MLDEDAVKGRAKLSAARGRRFIDSAMSNRKLHIAAVAFVVLVLVLFVAAR